MEIEATEVELFRQKYPEYDGRGVTIAVLDTGVDPGAPGLTRTTTGAAKLVGLIDCSGAGDIDTSSVAKIQVSPDGTAYVTGLTGRKLTIPPDWPASFKNEYRVGWKASSIFFPKELLALDGQFMSARKSTAERANNILLAEALKNLAAHEKKFPNLRWSENRLDIDADGEVGARTDLLAQIESLKSFMQEFKDSGPVYDFILFKDEASKWWAAVDISENGDLSKTTLLNPYADNFSFGTFTDVNLNYSFNVYDGGNILSIVVPAKSHGTHVAAISAAFFGDGVNPDGVAPGAQILSLKIGDTRLGSSETSQSLVRAATELLKWKVDVVNISYGEFCATYDYGQFVTLVTEEIIKKNGAVFVSSAGNSGPMLSSLSHPAGNTGVITVGANQTLAMQETMYTLLEPVPDRPFSFSSMGPTLDGAVGVDVYAPGAAIASVPQFTKNYAQLMNGTSMACPNVAGCCALIVSGLKSESQPVNPYKLCWAIRSTSKKVGDIFDVGMIQVLKTWDMMHAQAMEQATDVFYEGHFPKRGIYLREPFESNCATDHQVSVRPVFLRMVSDSKKLSGELDFDIQVTLKPSADWIRSPAVKFPLRMTATGREFLLRVDPTALDPGLHVAFVDGYVDKAGTVFRKYLWAPLGANFASITIKSKNRIGKPLFMVQFNQINPRSPKSEYESKWRVSLSSTSNSEEDGFEWSKKIRVLPSRTAEMWSSIDATTLTVDIKFHGLELTASSLSPTSAFGTRSAGDLIFLASGASGFSRMDLTSHLRTEIISAPSAAFTGVQKTLRPTDSAIHVLGERDTGVDGRPLYSLVLTYPFKVLEDTAVTPVLPMVLDAIYDSFFESTLICSKILFESADTDDISVLDSQQSYKSTHYSKIQKIKLSPGSYFAKLQIVSGSLPKLEKLKGTPISITQELKKSITVQAHKTVESAVVTQSEPCTKIELERGSTTSFYLPSVEESISPKNAVSPGDFLVGAMKLGDNVFPDLFRVTYWVPPAPIKSKESLGGIEAPLLAVTPRTESEESPMNRLRETIRDAQIAALPSVDGTQRVELIAKLEEEWGSSYVPLLVGKMNAYGGEFEKAIKKNNSVPPETVDALAKTCETVLSVLDLKDVAAYFGYKTDASCLSGEDAKTKKKTMARYKEAIILSLSWKAQLAKLSVLGSCQTSEEEKSASLRALESCLAELSLWVSVSDEKYALLWIFRLQQRGWIGSALSCCAKLLAELNDKNGASEMESRSQALAFKFDLLRALKWDFWIQYESAASAINSPPLTALF
ncbi:tripeptidyl-peptidase II Tpp2 [Entophlyctis sp. JEL0112]|nr:tripeptidyl-peptidase II Tpp2 [Entophlyctis sp. JEL0112]